jgi:hypothetical protein
MFDQDPVSARRSSSFPHDVLDRICAKGRLVVAIDIQRPTATTPAAADAQTGRDHDVALAYRA